MMGPKASGHIASLNDRLLSKSGLTQVDVDNKPDAVKGPLSGVTRARMWYR